MKKINWNDAFDARIKSDFMVKKNNATSGFMAALMDMNPDFDYHYKDSKAFVVDTGFGTANVSITPKNKPVQCRQFSEDSAWLISYDMGSGNIRVIPKSKLKIGTVTRIGPAGQKFRDAQLAK